MQRVFVLVHSPSVGPSTWHPVAEHLTAMGHQVRVPSLLDVGVSGPPFWPRTVGAVLDGIRQVPPGSPVVLVAHSNAVLFLAAIRSGLDHPVTGSIFVDAAPSARVGQTPVAPTELLEVLRPMAVDSRLPRWTDWWDEADVAVVFPDPEMRRTVVEEQPTLPLSYYKQHIPVPDGWDDHPCAYLLFGPPYAELATEARERGWRVVHLPGAHPHQLVDPAGTARHLIELGGYDVIPRGSGVLGDKRRPGPPSRDPPEGHGRRRLGPRPVVALNQGRRATSAWPWCPTGISADGSGRVAKDGRLQGGGKPWDMARSSSCSTSTTAGRDCDPSSSRCVRSRCPSPRAPRPCPGRSGCGPWSC
ncbi:hypothetical protein ACIP6V_30340 [Streptomyces sp. NPDC088770]|uniref:hypothetical protein n=1 Tax=Streptomyces sp. NPDC088770 TaxID=3365895 RepID=UPI0038256E30